MRTYEPAWIQLKTSEGDPKQLRIAAHPKLHRRIYKAIKKEKYMDSLYSLLLSENSQFATLARKSEGGVLIVSLALSIGMDDLTI